MCHCSYPSFDTFSSWTINHCTLVPAITSSKQICRPFKWITSGGKITAWILGTLFRTYFGNIDNPSFLQLRCDFYIHTYSFDRQKVAHLRLCVVFHSVSQNVYAWDLICSVAWRRSPCHRHFTSYFDLILELHLGRPAKKNSLLSHETLCRQNCWAYSRSISSEGLKQGSDIWLKKENATKMMMRPVSPRTISKVASGRPRSFAFADIVLRS